MWILVGLVLFYLLGVVLAYGLTFADFQGRYPELAESTYEADKVFARIIAVFSWLGVIIALSHGAAKRGFKLW